MLKFILCLSIAGIHNSYATAPGCHLLQQSQLAALNERMNQMIQALYSSPFLSSIAKTKSSLKSQESTSDYSSGPYESYNSQSPQNSPSPTSYSTPPPAYSPPIQAYQPASTPAAPVYPPSSPVFPPRTLSQPENANVIYVSPKTAASPPSVTIARTRMPYYPQNEYSYPPIEPYKERDYQLPKPVDPVDDRRQNYYSSYYQYPVASSVASENAARDYSYYYSDQEGQARPLYSAPVAQPSYLPAVPTQNYPPQAPVAPNYPSSPINPNAAPQSAYSSAVPQSTAYAAPVSSNSIPYTAQNPASSAAYGTLPSSNAYAPPAPASPLYATPAPSSPFGPQPYATPEYYSGYYT